MVTSACPATVWRTTASSVVLTHSELIAPSTAPALQPSETTRRTHSSPVTAGSGQGSRSPARLTAPAWPSPSSQEKTSEGEDPCSGRSYSVRSPCSRAAVPKKRSDRPSGPP